MDEVNRHRALEEQRLSRRIRRLNDAQLAQAAEGKHADPGLSGDKVRTLAQRELAWRRGYDPDHEW